MAANYKTITFRLDMNNPLEHRLYDTLAIQQTTSARNKLIKDVLIRSLLDNSAGAAAPEKDTGTDSGIKTMLEMLCGRISALEQSAAYGSPERNQHNTEDSRQNMGNGRKLQSQFMQEPAESEAQKQTQELSAGIKQKEQEADAQSVDPEQQPVQTPDTVVSQEALDFLAKGGFS